MKHVDRPHLALLRSERGTVMLPGIFMMLFLVAMLYAVVGLGRTMVLQEGMQDAADASAFSAAILHARGMNLIVLINVIMMILVAVLVAIRLAQTLLTIALTALTVGAFFSFGATATLIPPVTNGVQTLGQAYKTAKSIVLPLLSGLHAVQRATAVVVPWVALADGMIETAKHHPPAKGALALPGAIRLPVEPDKLSVLCDRAIEKAASFATSKAGSSVDTPDEDSSSFLSDIIEGSIKGLVQPTMDYLCGDGSEKPPKYSKTFTARQPQLPGLDACDEHNKAACEEAEEFGNKAVPEGMLEDGVSPEGTGRCQQECGPDGPYEVMSDWARDSCNPETHNDIDRYQWQLKEGTATFVYDGQEWKMEKWARTPRRRIQDTKKPPCGRNGKVGKEWNGSEPEVDNPGREEDGDPTPLCSFFTPPFQRGGFEPDTREDFLYKEVTRIFSCTKKVNKEFDVAEEDQNFGGEEGDTSRSPHKIEDDLELGDEAFQIRAIAFGKSPGPGHAQEGVDLVKHRLTKDHESAGGKVKEVLLDAASLIGSVSGAQAEYYFQYSEPAHRAEWMWHMNWTARLKHFRLPSKEEQEGEEARQEKGQARTMQDANEHGTSDEAPSAESSCSKAGGSDCGKTESRASELDGWIRH